MYYQAMRLFVALNFAQDLRDRWVAETASLRAAAPTAHWLPAEQLHLTLAFLGEQPDSSVAALRPGLDRLAASGAAHSLALHGIGAFPHWRRPRVIWLGVDPEPALLSLANSVAKACQALGIALDPRPFHPHITLGRIDARVSPPQVQRLEQLAGEVTGRWRTDAHAVDLMSSTLTPNGAKHELVHRAKLGIRD